MAGASSDRNLLFGILAVHLNFIDRDALVLAMNAWLVDKSTPLDEIMLRQGVLRPDLRELLATLVNKHLELHDGDPQRSLQALGKIDSVHDSLRSLGDADVEASLQHIALARDPMATTPLLVAASNVDQRFRIVRFHAEGALGKVSLAFDNELNREVALKEIKERHADHPESRARFTTEARITGRLEHPGVVPVYGMGAYADGRPYYAMRFIKGESLQEAIRAFHELGSGDAKPSERILELRRLLRHFVDACYAIHFAHSHGVLHRDIKPANIMLGKYGETLVVDWGLAKAMNKSSPGEFQDARHNGANGESPALTLLGSVVGTPAFMSPEQAAGQIHELSPASDV
jgi:serine/threonine-protein kinase